jgi:hypothetical protein
MARAAALRTKDDLRRYVHDTLCAHENLVPEQFALQEIGLTRAGRRCGTQFVLRGPREVRLAAVWASEQNQLYFYDALGARFRKEQLEPPLSHDETVHAS